MSNNIKNEVKIAKNDSSTFAGFEPNKEDVLAGWSTDLNSLQELYGVPPYYTRSDYKIRTGGRIFAIILFIIGLIALFNKKLSKKAKIIISISVVALIILTFIIIKFVTTYII